MLLQIYLFFSLVLMAQFNSDLKKKKVDRCLVGFVMFLTELKALPHRLYGDISYFLSCCTHTVCRAILKKQMGLLNYANVI